MLGDARLRYKKRTASHSCKAFSALSPIHTSRLLLPCLDQPIHERVSPLLAFDTRAYVAELSDPLTPSSTRPFPPLHTMPPSISSQGSNNSTAGASTASWQAKLQSMSIRLH